MTSLAVPPPARMWYLLLQLTVVLLLLISTLFLGRCSAAQSSAAVTVSLLVVEESRNGTVIGNLRTSLKQTNQFSASELKHSTFRFLSTQEFIALDPRTKDIYVVGRLDRETLCIPMQICCDPNDCVIKAQVGVFVDKSREGVENRNYNLRVVFLEIAIIDINDHTPAWPEKTLTVEVPEHNEAGFRINLPLPSDPDRAPDNTTAKFQLLAPSPNGGQLATTTDFSLATEIDNKGNFIGLCLQVDKELNRESQTVHHLVITAADGGSPPRTGTVSLSVVVSDVNDQPPRFLTENPTVNVSENSYKGHLIAQLRATDADPSDEGRLVYKFGSAAGPEIRELFTVNRRSGQVRLKGELDAEKRRTFSFPVAVSDGLHNVETTVNVRVTNINDHRPEVIVRSLSERNGSIWVEENKGIQMLATIIAHDRDDPKRTEPIVCSIDDPSFSLKELYRGTRNQFTLWSQHSFDRELLVAFSPVITCVDSGQPRLSSVVPLQILVEDVNDNAPKFKVPSRPVIHFPENRPKSSLVLTAYATDADVGINARLIYSLDSTSQHWFHIDPFSGQLKTKVIFDREVMTDFNLTLTARDHGGSPFGLATHQSLSIKIMDVNDCRPTFTQDLYEFTMTEGQRLNNVVGQVQALDDDVDFHNRLLTYHIRPLVAKDNVSVLAFRVSSDGSILVDRETIDRELHPVYRLLVVAVDHGEPRLSGSATVSITVRDLNDNSPKWSFPVANNNTLNVSMFTVVGTELGKLSASDPDIGPHGDVEYRIVSGNDQNLFDVDRKTGVIFLSRSIAKESIRLQKFVVEAKDRGRPPMTSLGVLNILLVEDRQASTSAVEVVFGHEVTLLIVMGTGTFLIFLLLLLTIFLIRLRRVGRSNNKRQSSKRNHPQDPSQDEGRQLYPRYQLDAFSMPSSSELSSGSGNNVCSRRKVEEKKLKDSDSMDSGQGRSSDARSNPQHGASSTTSIISATCVRCPPSAPPGIYSRTEPGGLFRGRRRQASANAYETCISFPNPSRTTDLQPSADNSTTLV